MNFFDARHFFLFLYYSIENTFTFLSKITFRKHLFSFIQQYLFIIISCTIMPQKKFAYTCISGYSCSLSGRTVIIEFSPVLILRSIGALMIKHCNPFTFSANPGTNRVSLQ